MRQKIVNDRWLIEETTALDELVIRPGGQIDAPEGKFVALTVDGAQADIRPGEYTGRIELRLV